MDATKGQGRGRWRCRPLIGEKTKRSALMKSSIIKRSVVIGGHKTSVSLEEPFWIALKQIAHAQHVTLSALVAQIDDTREQSNLSSAIRVFVLRHSRLAQRPSGPVDRTRARGERNQL